MDITMGAAAKVALDLMKNDNVLNKASRLMGMLFPYAGINQKAVKIYVDEIEKSDLSPEAKVYSLINIKKTFKHIKNQKSIADLAMENAKENTDFSEQSGVSEEWLDRFMDSARFVSSEELQLVWGKILANEFERPGSTPPNMIRVLSEFTPSMAKAFRLICSMSLWIIPLKEDGSIEDRMRIVFVPFEDNEEKFRGMGTGFETLNELESLGVLRFDVKNGYAAQVFANNKLLICVGDNIDVIEAHMKDKIPIGNVLLTSVGEALLAITENLVIEDYHDMVRKYLTSKRVPLANEHEFVVRTEGDSFVIERKEYQ